MNSLFPNLLHVSAREYTVRVLSRSFAWSTLLLALLAMLATLVPTVVLALGVVQPTRVAVYSTDTALSEHAAAVLSATFSTAQSEVATSTVNDPEAARAEVRDGTLDGLLLLERDETEELEFDFYGSAAPASKNGMLLQQAAHALSIDDRLQRAGLDTLDRVALFEPPRYESISPQPQADGDASQFGVMTLVAYAVVIVTFMAIMTYGNWVAQSVAEEKSNRVMELLITAATPRQLLVGKVVGTGGAGLTQYGGVLAGGLLGLLLSGLVARSMGAEIPAAAANLPIPSLGALLACVAFFIGGFLLYLTLYAATGSLVSRIEDVQYASGPLIVISMISYGVASLALAQPDAAWVQVVSMIPFFSPYLMPARILLLTPSPAEIAGALALLVLTIAVALVLASRIYAAGVLLYGQRASLLAVLRASRVKR